MCIRDRLIKDDRDGRKRYEIENVIYIEADNVWSTIVAADKKSTISVGLGKIEDAITKYPYPSLVRIHSKHIVNLDHIKENHATPKSGGKIILSNGIEAKVSLKYAKSFWTSYTNHFSKN